MSINKPASDPEKRDKKLSLAPLTPEQALFKALNTAPPKPTAKKKAASSKRRPKP